MVELDQLTEISLALGERLIDPEETKEALDFNAIKYIQVDIGDFGNRCRMNKNY